MFHILYKICNKRACLHLLAYKTDCFKMKRHSKESVENTNKWKQAPDIALLVFLQKRGKSYHPNRG